MRKGWSLLLLPLALALSGQEGCPPTDADGDGYTVGDGDCNDNNAAIFPGAPEVCDGLDNDCDRKVDPLCWGSGSALWGSATW